MKIRKKTLLAAIVITLVATTLVSATLLSYFGKVTTTVDITQAIQIDGQDNPVSHEIHGVGGDQFTFDHYIINNNNKRGAELYWNHSFSTRNDGIDVKVVETPTYLGMLNISVFNGYHTTHKDSFTVRISHPVEGSIEVYQYHGGNTDTWIDHEIDLTPYQIPIGDTYKIIIEAIGIQDSDPPMIVNAVAIRNMELYTDTGFLCDYVDIGDTESEIGHNLVDWTIPIDNEGSTYRYVFGRRVNEKRASIEMNCIIDDFSVLPELNPFDITASEKIDVTFVYTIDFMCPSTEGTITSTLNLVE